MTTTPVSTYLSEISTLELPEPNLMGFRLSPEIDRELGNQLSYHFSRQFPDLVVTWHDKSFWVLGKPQISLPTSEEWKTALTRIQKEIEGFRSYFWSFQWLQAPLLTPQVLAQLAPTIFQKERCFQPTLVTEKQGVVVNREVKFWSETIEIREELKSAFVLTIKSQFVYRENLEEFYENHPFRNDPEKLLIGLKVRENERGSSGTIVRLGGRIGEEDNRIKLIEQATGSTSITALEEAPNDQPIVSVKFESGKKEYSYAMAALGIIITPESAKKLGINYGELKKLTNIPFQDRQELLKKYKDIAKNTLKLYGYQVSRQSVNSRPYPELFRTTPISQTKLLFGKGYIGNSNEILIGLTKGGVYQRHQDYQDFDNEIKIVALKLCSQKVSDLLDKVQERLQKYGFSCNLLDKVSIPFDENDYSGSWAIIEEKLNELLSFPTDIFLVFLPQSDRQADSREEGSLYYKIYSHLLNRRIASQFIYEKTLRKTDSKHILDQVIPGILAKLGNIPFVLAEPLAIADCFLGLDISRKPKANSPGTLNACASIRIYGQRGDFIRYQLEGDMIEGEEIPQRLIEKILPVNLFKNKTVLLYRDGYFVNREVDNFLARAKAINAQFILVECRKSKIPRLYNFVEGNISAPTRGLALKLSSCEAIVVTTQVSGSVGLACPLRLTIRPEGHQVNIESVVETTLKLTLLHHGALKTPRLPMPLHGADRMAELWLKGIYPSVREGDRQFWL